MQMFAEDIVRLTFKAFHDVLKAQGDAIKLCSPDVGTSLGSRSDCLNERQIKQSENFIMFAAQTLERKEEHKATKSEVAATLAQKAGTHELNAKLLEINAALASKADGSEVASQLRKLTPKAEIQSNFKAMMSEVKNILDSKVSVDEFQNCKCVEASHCIINCVTLIATYKCDDPVSGCKRVYIYIHAYNVLKLFPKTQIHLRRVQSDYTRLEHENATEALKVEVRRKAFTEDVIARLETK
eukprot:756050-Prorocentrum_minimum.AAC.1